MARSTADRSTVPRNPITRQKARLRSHERAQHVAIQSIELRAQGIEEVVWAGLLNAAEK
jgi:hypothetical protein